MKYEVGQYVRVKTLEEIKECSDSVSWGDFKPNGNDTNYFFSREMRHYCGFLYKVVVKYGGFYTLSGNSYRWEDWMLKNAIDTMLEELEI